MLFCQWKTTTIKVGGDAIIVHAGQCHLKSPFPQPAYASLMPSSAFRLDTLRRNGVSSSSAYTGTFTLVAKLRRKNGIEPYYQSNRARFGSCQCSGPIPPMHVGVWVHRRCRTPPFLAANNVDIVRLLMGRCLCACTRHNVGIRARSTGMRRYARSTIGMPASS